MWRRRVRQLRRRARFAGQAAVAWTLYWMLRAVPLRAASGFGGWLGRRIGPRLRVTDVARRNLVRAFPDKSEAEREAIVREMWDNLGRTAFEFPHLDRLRFDGSSPDVEVVGGEWVERLRDDDRPGIFFSGHLANWEVSALSVMHGGVPIHLIYRAPNNPFMAGLFDRRNPGKGELLPKGRAGARRALQLLKAGEHLGMLVDQKMNDGIAVPFFGREAMTAPALAQLALRYRCPVVPTRVERLAGARFRVTHMAPLDLPDTGDRQAGIAAMMATVNGCLEEWIRDRPAQWLWLHNRWKD